MAAEVNQTERTIGAYTARSVTAAVPLETTLFFAGGALLVLVALASVSWAERSDLAIAGAAVLGLLYTACAAVLAFWHRRPRAFAAVRAMAPHALAAVLLAQSAVALGQFALQRDLGLWWLGEPQVAAAGGFSILEGGGKLWLRSYGLSPHPNILGGALTLGILLLGRDSRPKFLHTLIICLSCAALLVTFSRSAWLALAVGLAFLLVQHPTKALLRASVVALCAGLIALLLLQPDLLRGRLLLDQSVGELRSLAERRELNQAALRLIQTHPLRGVGMSNFVTAASDYLPEHDDLQPVHNGVLLVSAELGAPAGLLWLTLTSLPIAALWPQRHHSGWHRCLIAALLASIVLDSFDMYFWQWSFGQVMRWLLWLAWLTTIQQPETG